MGRTISAPICCATDRKPPSCVLVSRNSSMAAAPASGRNDASVVGTGENVLVSCIIIATTILGAVIGGLLARHATSRKTPAASRPARYSSSDETGVGGKPGSTGERQVELAGRSAWEAIARW